MFVMGAVILLGATLLLTKHVKHSKMFAFFLCHFVSQCVSRFSQPFYDWRLGRNRRDDDHQLHWLRRACRDVHCFISFSAPKHVSRLFGIASTN